jgi:hypothetical protein
MTFGVDPQTATMQTAMVQHAADDCLGIDERYSGSANSPLCR